VKDLKKCSSGIAIGVQEGWTPKWSRRWRWIGLKKKEKAVVGKEGGKR